MKVDRRVHFILKPSRPNSPPGEEPRSSSLNGSRALPVRARHSCLYVVFSFWSSASRAAVLFASARKDPCCACSVDVIAISDTEDTVHLLRDHRRRATGLFRPSVHERCAPQLTFETTEIIKGVFRVDRMSFWKYGNKMNPVSADLISNVHMVAKEDGHRVKQREGTLHTLWRHRSMVSSLRG